MDEPSMELLEIWTTIRRRLRLVVLIVVVSMVTATCYSLHWTALYRTTTTLYLKPGTSSPVLPYQVTRSVNSLARTYAELMRTRSFGELVVLRMGEGTTPDEVLGAISTRYVKDTQFFKVTATHADPETAQALANTAAQVLMAEAITRRQAEQRQIQAQQDPVKELELKRLRKLRQNLQNKLDYYDEHVGEPGSPDLHVGERSALGRGGSAHPGPAR